MPLLQQRIDSKLTVNTFLNDGQKSRAISILFRLFPRNEGGSKNKIKNFNEGRKNRGKHCTRRTLTERLKMSEKHNPSMEIVQEILILDTEN